MCSEGNYHLSVPLLSQRPYAVEYEAFEVLGLHVSVQSHPIPIFFPQRKHVRLLLASGDVEGDDAFFLTRGVAQFSQHRFSFVRVCWSKREMDGLNDQFWLGFKDR